MLREARLSDPMLQAMITSMSGVVSRGGGSAYFRQHPREMARRRRALSRGTEY